MPQRRVTLPNVTEYIREGKLHCQKGSSKKEKSCYAVLIAASTCGVARFEVYDNEKHLSSHCPNFMVIASDVVKVEKTMLSEKTKKSSFLVSTRDQHYIFSVDSSTECEGWLSDIQKTLFEDVHNNLTHGQKIFTEVNDLYESAEDCKASGAPQNSEFLVMIEDENTWTKMRTKGQVRLIVENECIAVITPSGKMIVRWHVKQIRQFLFTSKAFSMEAGRKSPLGEGTFVFHTDKGEDIHALITKNRRHIKDKLEETRHHPSPGLVSTPKKYPSSIPREALTFSSPKSPKAASYWDDSEIYDTFEELRLPPSPIAMQPQADIVHSQQQGSPTKLKSHTKPVAPIKHSSIQSANQNIKQQGTKVGASYQPGNQVIYSEPQIITDAWKSYGQNDDRENDLYSSLNFTHQKEDEGHYWQGPPPVVPATQEIEEKIKAEDIYAEVDFSKKSKNRK